MDIVKQLEKEKEKRLSDSQSTVEGAKLLLSSSVAEENKLLHDLGLDDHLIVVEKANELTILDRQYAEKYEGKVFHINELAKIGCKYRMFLKVAKLYRGTVPGDLGAILLRLKQKHNLNISQSDFSDGGKIYIMAPPVLFKDYLTVGDKIMEEITDSKTKFKKFFQAPDPEPMLFYKVDDSHFVLLKKWGKDFTFIRRITGWFSETNKWVYMMMFTVLYFVVQLPFRAWQWADIWVYPHYLAGAKQNGPFTLYNCGNTNSYVFSHLLWFVIGALLGVVIVRMIIGNMIEVNKWSLSKFSTKSFYKDKFGV